jgi:DNA-binding transcriptional LysR family regulator
VQVSANLANGRSLYASAVERGVSSDERRRVALNSLNDWDAARVFLEAARCGSFRSAAEKLRLSINAVRRRIGDFERQSGATMFIRDVHDARLTEEGVHGVAAVERMEAAALDLLRASARASLPANTTSTLMRFRGRQAASSIRGILKR